ncbi:hypothetical protein BOTBODRAFT_32004 [Botryobasidium botryosum FD-172 SS1]|uniref:FAD/NAD(P)-binding domain-containing protein n=1 Tax=Botryobasidium botryosum (strain FD-172 SS1) TaxID=930990 RepID=A0A067MHJ5_BOTB1|nr:hypothetical protein BOTBODRAFT_32004 [Botryobasidium botryosum FD-172 SS1]
MAESLLKDNTLSPTAIAEDWLGRIEAAFKAEDPSAVSALFSTQGCWRDLLSLSWNFRSLDGPAAIKDYLGGEVEGNTITNITLVGEATLTTVSPELSWIQAIFGFETSVARGRGVARLVQDPETKKWLAFTFYTGIEALRGHEPRADDIYPDDAYSEEQQCKLGSAANFDAPEDQNPDVVIVGGGQAGLTIAARFAKLDVNALVIENNPRIGDNWRNRYDTLVLHEPIYYDHLPYLPFPETWPFNTNKDRFGNWLELYARALKLNIWTSTSLSGQPKYDEAAKQWTVAVTRPDGSVKTLHPKHIVMATGVFGQGVTPAIQGSEDFRGSIIHSSEFKSGRDYVDKKVLVIGVGTSGVDIAKDLYDKGAHPTLIQRSSSIVLSSSALVNVYSKGMWDGTGPHTEIADLLQNSFPLPLMLKFQTGRAQAAREYDAAMLEGLAKAVFALDDGPDGGGIIAKVFKVGPSGYYIDVGAASLIIDGKIKIKQGQEVHHLEENAAIFPDGSRLDADAIILATGYKDIKDTVAKVFGEDVAAGTSPAWGLDDEGEVKGLARPTGHPGLWFHAGNIAMCRFYSTHLALQIKARLVGLVGE